VDAEWSIQAATRRLEMILLQAARTKSALINVLINRKIGVGEQIR
jgi:hypothetical protein